MKFFFNFFEILLCQNIITNLQILMTFEFFFMNVKLLSVFAVALKNVFFNVFFFSLSLNILIFKICMNFVIINFVLFLIIAINMSFLYTIYILYVIAVYFFLPFENWKSLSYCTIY